MMDPRPSHHYGAAHAATLSLVLALLSTRAHPSLSFSPQPTSWARLRLLVPGNVPQARSLRDLRRDSSASGTRRYAMVFDWNDDDDEPTVTIEESKYSRYSPYGGEYETAASTSGTTTLAQSDRPFAQQQSADQSPASHDPYAAWHSSHSQPNTESLRDKLSHDPYRRGSLARLATAHAPPNAPLHLADITEIELLSLDGDHLDIRAVVPEGELCVAHLIPVRLRHHCEENADGSMEECVIDNLEELDAEASAAIKLLHLEGRKEDGEREWGGRANGEYGDLRGLAP